MTHYPSFSVLQMLDQKAETTISTLEDFFVAKPGVGKLWFTGQIWLAACLYK